MPSEWEYDPETRLITSKNSNGDRRLVATRIKPREARIVFGLIGVAKQVAGRALDPNPLGCKPSCKCLACEARRLLDAIGGGE